MGVDHIVDDDDGFDEVVGALAFASSTPPVRQKLHNQQPQGQSKLPFHLIKKFLLESVNPALLTQIKAKEKHPFILIFHFSVHIVTGKKVKY